MNKLTYLLLAGCLVGIVVLIFIFSRPKPYEQPTNHDDILNLISTNNQTLLRENNEMIRLLSDSVLANIKQQTIVYNIINKNRDEQITRYNQLRTVSNDTIDSMFNAAFERMRTNYRNGRYRAR